ncbi:MAG TPA: hypothetical protein VGG74_22485 [Kofleriaceae bacterium]|jgi:hypothetical protein
MRFRALVAMLAVPTLALGAPKKKSAPAAGEPAPPPTTKTPSPCGDKILPLAVGNSWTYEMVPSPLPPDDQIKRISPAEVDSITVTVKSIEAAPKGGDTTITLEEKTSTDLLRDKGDPKHKPVLDEHTYTSTIVCNAKKFEISPESFFFSGEPGGYIGIKVDSIERPKGTSWQLTNGGIGDQPWREDVHMKWTRTPFEGSEAKLGSGRIELERQFTPEQPEPVATKLGVYTSEKLGLVTTGRVFSDTAAADAKPMELPANWITTLWIAPGAGVVQTLNPYAHMYQLTQATLK